MCNMEFRYKVEPFQGCSATTVTYLLATASTSGGGFVKTSSGATGASVMVGMPGFTTTSTLSPASPVATGVAVMISSSLIEISWLSCTVTVVVVVVVVEVEARSGALPGKGPVVAIALALALVAGRSS